MARRRVYRHFKSKAGYRKYEAFVHMHHVPHRYHKWVEIKGHLHRVTKSKVR